MLPPQQVFKHDSNNPTTKTQTHTTPKTTAETHTTPDTNSDPTHPPRYTNSSQCQTTTPINFAYNLHNTRRRLRLRHVSTRKPRFHTRNKISTCQHTRATTHTSRADNNASDTFVISTTQSANANARDDGVPPFLRAYAYSR
jgi:hypothetical protein